MKNPISFVFLLLSLSLYLPLHAQRGGISDAYEKGMVLTDLYSGIGRYYGPRDYISSRIPVFGGVSYAITDQLSAGVFMGWREITYKFANFSPTAVNYYNYGVKAEWHITRFLNDHTFFNLPSHRYDVYVAGHAGFQTNDAGDKALDLFIGSSAVRVLGFHFGARVYTLSRVGFLAEFGFTPNTLLNLGVCAKF